MRSTNIFPGDAGAVQATGAKAPCRPAARPWVLAATILASGMVFIDGTMVNVALPALQTEFNADAADTQWIIESYALLLTALLLVGGSAGDLFGRRKVFALGVVLFALASGLCAMATSIWMLIGGRALQGLGGALLVPGSLALLSASFPDNVRGKAIGIWSAYTSITAALGPVMGGYLIEHWSWRYAFLINVPLAAIVLVLAYIHVPESRNDDGPRKLDWPGATLVSVGLGCLVYGLIAAPSRGWGDPAILGVLLCAMIALIGFVVVESRHPAPMLPLQLFRSSNFAGANLLTFFLYAALGGSLYFVPLNLIQVQAYTATEAGAAMLPFILTMFLLSNLAGRMADRIGTRLPLIVGPCIAGCGFVWLAVPGVGGSYWTTFFPGMLVLGLGMAISVAPLTTTVMNSVEQGFVGAASGTNNAVSRAASLLAIAVFGIVMSHAFSQNLSQRLNVPTLDSQVRHDVVLQKDKLAAIEIPAAASENDRAFIAQAISGSFVTGFRYVMLVSALLAFVSAMTARLMLDSWAVQQRMGA